MIYTVYVDNYYRENFQSLADAMAYIEVHARPYNMSWKIVDSYQQVVAQS